MDFTLRDEDDSDDDDLKILPDSSKKIIADVKDDGEDSEEEEGPKAVLANNAPRKLHTKELTEEEKKIWSTVNWPSTLPKYQNGEGKNSTDS